MWRREDCRAPAGGSLTPPPSRNTMKRVYAAMPMSERKRKSSTEKQEAFHMIHKVHSDYVRPKYAQKSGMVQQEAELHEHKLKPLEPDTHFGGRITIVKRYYGKQINGRIEQEKARTLGNLAQVHLQNHNYGIAEQCYRNALSLEPDNNKLCNLAICLIRMDRIREAKSLLKDVRQSTGNLWRNESLCKSFLQATEMLAEREQQATVADNPKDFMQSSSSDNFSSVSSFASWTKQNKVLARTSPEPGNMCQNNSHVSCESVNQNSPGLIAKPQECKWGDNEVDYRKGQETSGAAPRLGFRKRVESEASTNALYMKMCADLVKENEDSEKEYQRNDSGSSSAYAQIMDIGI